MAIDPVTKVFLEAETSLQIIRLLMGGKNRIRGYQARLSEYIGCHPSHLSKALRGHAILTMEQAVCSRRHSLPDLRM